VTWNSNIIQQATWPQ